MRWCGCLHIVPRDEWNHCKMLGWKISKTGYRILPFHAIYMWSQLFERWTALYFHPINPHPLDSAISFPNTYPLDSNFYYILRYWWNTRIFPFTKKSYLQRAQWRYYFYLLRVRILVSPWLLTLILTFWNRKYYCLYFSFITLYPSCITFLWQAFCHRWPL